MPTLFNVSNRLPITIKEGKITRSSGGLVAALEGLPKDRFDLRWIGWPGEAVEDEGKLRELTEHLEKEYQSTPVFLSSAEASGFYEGLSNSSLWPVLHAMPSYMKFDRDWWSTYEKVNQCFADAIAEQVHDDDLVWVHDYQLMLLPAMLRAARPKIKIGFFLHTPFPPFDVFRFFPRRREIISGLLGADVAGFHTFSYLRHFRATAARLLDIEEDYGSGADQIAWNNHVTRLGVFPIGIHAARFDRELSSIEFAQKKDEFLRARAGRRVVLSVERLDYTKGILHRLDAIELYLSRLDAAGREGIQFIFISVPSREGVEDYRDLREEIESRIGRLNGKFATLTNSPIHFVHGSVNFAELCALYATSEVALITPLIDGMNLVAKEYFAARADNEGVLVLSEFAGAAEELISAIRVNPHDTAAVADSIVEALAMPQQERRERAAPMRQRIMENDAAFWAKSFIDALDAPTVAEHSPEVASLSNDIASRLREAISAGKGAVMILDYDGTLREIVADPMAAGPTGEVKRLLDRLAALHEVRVAIVSGRTRDDLERFLGEYPFALVAEHGGEFRDAGSREWRELPSVDAQRWKDRVVEVMRRYESLTPGSFIESKRTSVVWHFRRADADLGEWRARRLLVELSMLTSDYSISVRRGRKIIEAGDRSISKGAAARMLLDGAENGFVLCAGDDATDESLFDPLPAADAITIKVGDGQSAAKYRVQTPGQLRELLGRVVDAMERDRTQTRVAIH